MSAQHDQLTEFEKRIQAANKTIPAPEKKPAPIVTPYWKEIIDHDVEILLRYGWKSIVDYLEQMAYSYMVPGKEGYNYYKWKKDQLLKSKQHLSCRQNRALQSTELAELNALFSQLSGSQESIHAANKWIMDHFISFEDCIDQMQNRLDDKIMATNPLYLLYLINDLIFYSGPTPMQTDQLGYMTYRIAISSQDRPNVNAIIDLWAKHHVFSPSDTALWKTQIIGFISVPSKPTKLCALMSDRQLDGVFDYSVGQMVDLCQFALSKGVQVYTPLDWKALEREQARQANTENAPEMESIIDAYYEEFQKNK